MPLSENVETEIVEYLHLEYGQRPHEDGAIKVTDLEYLGRFQIDQTPVHYWRIAGLQPEGFATIEEWSDGTLCTGTAYEEPPSTALIDKHLTWRTGENAAPPKDTKRHAWLLFLSPIFLWGLVKMLWGVRSFAKQLTSRQRAVSKLPLPEALHACADVPRSVGPSLHLRPADAGASTHLQALAGRLNSEPPSELLAFYEQCDGTYWEGENYETPILPAREVKYGRDYSPPFSSLIRRSLITSGDDPAKLTLIPMGDFMALIKGEEESGLAVDAADDWLLLQAPNTEADTADDGDYYLRRVVAISTQPVGDYPAGTVFEFEGGSASVAPSIAALLGHWTALAESVNDMQRKYKK